MSPVVIEAHAILPSGIQETPLYLLTPGVICLALAVSEFGATQIFSKSSVWVVTIALESAVTLIPPYSFELLLIFPCSPPNYCISYKRLASLQRLQGIHTKVAGHRCLANQCETDYR